jgi:putative glutathione S-transferase
MGMMIDGRWMAHAERTVEKGAFVRSRDVFDRLLDAPTVEGIAGGTGRYVLVASMSCPWSHRVLLLRAVKRLEDRLPLHIAGGPRVEGYGLLADGPIGTIAGKAIRHVHQLYSRSDPAYSGRVTVPFLWDLENSRIVSNNSARLMRGLDNVVSPGGFTLVPGPLLFDIDALNAWMFDGLSNAVYRAGLAEKQNAYNEAVDAVFATLDALETRLATQRFLFGAFVTESDLQLFATLVRFDAVYATHFRCTRRRLVDYPHLWAYARDLFQQAGIGRTIDFDTILEGYYVNDGVHNPHAIIAERPRADWLAGQDRDRFGPVQLWSRMDGPTSIAHPPSSPG